jgi:carbon monoxide dehydrogenase subunit G
MLLEHEFVVPVPVDRAWDVLLDVERISPCMPGATVESFDGETVSGKVKVKVGPIQVSYAGTASFIEKDEAARRLVLDAHGKEARGPGTAAAKIVAVLLDEGGESTRVTVTTDLAITGRPAQFGRGVMADVGNKLLGRFADCLATTIGADQDEGERAGASSAANGSAGAGAAHTGAPARMATAPGHPDAPVRMATAPGHPDVAPPSMSPASLRAAPEAEALDLFAVAGWPMLRRALAPAAGLLVAVAFLHWLSRRRHRR